MKKAILLLFVLASLICKSQDSVRVIISVQARDVEYIGSFLYHDNNSEDLYDTLKRKFRIANPPTGNTIVSVSGYTQDWISVLSRLNNDPTAIKALCTKRVTDLLRAVNQTYLTNKLNAMDTADADTFQSMRQFGRSKLRRQ